MPFLAQPLVAAIELTYVEFHLVAVIPPIVLLVAMSAVHGGDIHPAAVTVIATIALAYTAPWDNYLIARGVWQYAPGSTVMTIFNAPIEEYAFILLQTILASLWFDQVGSTVEEPISISMVLPTRIVGITAGAVVGIAGWAALAREPTFYLGAILVWAAPVLAFQWGFGWPYLWRHRRTVALAVLVPTIYLWIADGIAIRVGIWTLSERYTTGISVFGLPVEEAAFFLLTNLFIIQGLVLCEWVIDQ